MNDERDQQAFVHRSSFIVHRSKDDERHPNHDAGAARSARRTRPTASALLRRRHPRGARGRDGVAPRPETGVAVDTPAAMDAIFDGINLEDVTVSMTINSTSPILLAMYLAVAEKQGADWKKISGTLQNDILKEYIAQKEYIFPPRPSMPLITDIFKYCAENVPKYNTISISGYHIREAGSTALQELAFTLRDGMEYVEYGTRAGLDIDEFAPRLSS